jgi:hypothetical protein
MNTRSFKNSRRRSSVALLCGGAIGLCLAAFAMSAPAATLQVPAQFSTIQAAIEAASHSDVVQVSPGTYNENLNFRGKAISVVSIGGAEQTILDAGQRGPAIIIRRTKNVANDAMLRGFTVQNGRGRTDSEGGGVVMWRASPTITGNIFKSNIGCSGAAIFATNGGPIVKNNTFVGNTNDHCIESFAGAVQFRFTKGAVLDSNTIEGSEFPNGLGGGVSISYSEQFRVTRNIIRGNVAREGGGLYISGFFDGFVANNLIHENRAPWGAGVHLTPLGEARPSLVNNTIANNVGTFGAQAFIGGYPRGLYMANNILYGLSSEATLHCDTSMTVGSPDAWHNIVFNGQGPAIGNGCENFFAVNDNMETDPRFAPVDGHRRYDLSGKSPALDAGINVPNQKGMETDVIGRPRVVDGNSDQYPIIDLGAMERSAASR